MNTRRGNQSSRRSGTPQVQFCERCGGVVSGGQGGNANTACRCTNEERTAYRSAGAARTANRAAQVATAPAADSQQADSAPSAAEEAEQEQARQLREGEESPA